MRGVGRAGAECAATPGSSSPTSVSYVRTAGVARAQCGDCDFRFISACDSVAHLNKSGNDSDEKSDAMQDDGMEVFFDDRIGKNRELACFDQK